MITRCFTRIRHIVLRGTHYRGGSTTEAVQDGLESEATGGEVRLVLYAKEKRFSNNEA